MYTLSNLGCAINEQFSAVIIAFRDWHEICSIYKQIFYRRYKRCTAITAE